jgi:NhaP-type Na+/H+ or K+/H+ antiporter
MEGLNKLPELEASLIFIMSLLTYGLCELEDLNLAPIVAIFIFGIVQSHYNRYNLSSQSVEKAG